LKRIRAASSAFRMAAPQGSAARGEFMLKLGYKASAEQMERLADRLPAERTVKRWIVSSDPDEHVEKIMAYVALGFRHLVFHGPGPDQERFLKLYSQHILPRVRAAAG